MFAQPDTRIIADLARCSVCVYQRLDPAETLVTPRLIAAEQPEIRGAYGEANHINVECAESDLKLMYDSYALMLDSGQVISIHELEAKSTAYWEAWEAQNRRNAE